MIKWLIVIAILLYIYNELKINLESTVPEVNAALGLPIVYSVHDLLNPTTGNLPIRVRVSF